MIRLFKVSMTEAAISASSSVLSSGYIGQGKKVEDLELKAKQALGLKRAPLAMNSCTSALDLCFHLVGIKYGSEVISTPMTCTATNSQLKTRGARIIWADVEHGTGLINPEDVRKKISRRTKAIVVVNWGGRSCDYATLRVVAAKYGVPIIEDAAHCWMSRYRGKPTGSDDGYTGDYICWSLQAIKFLTSVDGGLLVTPLHQYPRAKLLRWYGLDRDFSDSFRCEQTIGEVGYKYHMNDVCASIAIENMDQATRNVEAHRANAKFFHDGLQETSGGQISLPKYDPDCSYWIFTILVKERDKFTEFMKSRDIEVSPVHSRCDRHPPFHSYSGDLPGLDYFNSRQVSIPCGWWLTIQDKEHILKCLREWNKA
jgi:perosamine synthetase